jgi:hypothetical protein
VSFGTFIGNIYDLQVSIDFSFHGDARIGSWLSKYENFKGKGQSICPEFQEVFNLCISLG